MTRQIYRIVKRIINNCRRCYASHVCYYYYGLIVIKIESYRRMQHMKPKPKMKPGLDLEAEERKMIEMVCSYYKNSEVKIVKIKEQSPLSVELRSSLASQRQRLESCSLQAALIRRLRQIKYEIYMIRVWIQIKLQR